jgi:hypothetical protein
LVGVKDAKILTLFGHMAACGQFMTALSGSAVSAVRTVQTQNRLRETAKEMCRRREEASDTAPRIRNADFEAG